MACEGQRARGRDATSERCLSVDYAHDTQASARRYSGIGARHRRARSGDRGLASNPARSGGNAEIDRRLSPVRASEPWRAGARSAIGAGNRPSAQQNRRSVGWTVAIGSGSDIFAALLPRQTYEQVYRNGPDVILAGSAQPVGTAVRMCRSVRPPRSLVALRAASILPAQHRPHLRPREILLRLNNAQLANCAISNEALVNASHTPNHATGARPQNAAGLVLERVLPIQFDKA